jgi:NADH-quinone oxidoreductase subunit A
MPQNYVPIFIFMAVVGVLLPFTLLLAKLVRPDNPSKAKLMPYECGIDPIDNARGRYTVRYYIIAILFVVFDVETIFLFPWAVKFKALGVFGLVEILIFLVILIVGLHLGLAERCAGMGVTPPVPAAEPLAESFTASRWTQGNFLSRLAWSSVLSASVA